MSDQVVVRQGPQIGFAGMLALLFIGLKLGGVINWSWLWVLSPLWIPLAIVMAIFGFIGLGLGITALVALIADKLKK